MGLNVWSHRTLYLLYKNRKKFDPFHGRLSEFPEKLKYIFALEASNKLDLFADELD